MTMIAAGISITTGGNHWVKPTSAEKKPTGSVQFDLKRIHFSNGGDGEYTVVIFACVH